MIRHAWAMWGAVQWGPARRIRRLGWLAVPLALAGCEQRFWVCGEVDEDLVAKVPSRLSETGLFANMATEALGDGVSPYRPLYSLWSDGADKRRWVWLPPGQVIDASDADDWSFPEGTKFWKEFTRDGVRIETRLLTKLGPSDADWLGVAYLWTDGLEAYLAPYGVVDGRGTPHDVPASNECMACHGGTRSRVLGFSAIQLAAAAEEGALDLGDLQERQLLSGPRLAAPVVPGDEVACSALGYLHANCGHCHNQNRPEAAGARCFDPRNDLDLRLSVHSLGAVEDTAAFRTFGRVVEAGHPERSRLIEFMSNRGLFAAMPPLASERVDREGIEVVSRFIQKL